jgi:hypothetical protein
LESAGYWNDPSAWKYYGDMENNFSTIGNQQRSPAAALVEKLINSVDAVLIKECISRGISPQSTKAPQSIQQALKEFFIIREGNLAMLRSMKEDFLKKWSLSLLFTII